MIYIHEGGKLTPSSTRPFTKDTLCWAASMAKLVTTIAVLQCIEKGLIEMDDPVEKFLPELADPDILEGFSDDGEPILRKAKEKITLRYVSQKSSFHITLFPNLVVFKNASQSFERS
jgi:CubicO group peptidase (beta-lactamase class C family)